MKTLIKYLLIILISFVILIVTLGIPKTVNSKEDMKAVKLGYPISFVTQDFTKYDPPFPWQYSFGSPLENPFEISWINFFLSYSIILLSIGVVDFGIEKLISSSKKQQIS
jgi:hypothetical protein